MEVLLTSILKNLNFCSICSDFRAQGVFFFQTKFVFLTGYFDRIFLQHSKGTVVLSLNLKRFHLWSFFVKLWGLKIVALVNLKRLALDTISCY